MTNDKIDQYLNGVFAPYEGVKSVAELKSDLSADLQERYRELKAEGMDEDTAFTMTIDSIGDIDETVQEIANLSRSLERQVLISFSAGNLPDSDFAGVTAHKGKFDSSALRGSDFSGADLTGSSFKSSDLREANFDRANLTDCIFFSNNLANATFNNATLVRTEFKASELSGARFSDAKLTDVKLDITDLRKVVFENCVFNGVTIKHCDLRGQSLDGLTFIGVRFDRVELRDTTFDGATLINTSFVPTFALTNKHYKAIKFINFDGAMMDKLTYASLKGMEADLSQVTVIK